MTLRPGTPEEVGMSGQRVRQVVDLARAWVTEGITPTLVILVARHGIVVVHEAFGRLTPDPASGPVQLDTIFPLASITKPLTATAAMILAEDGLLGLNRPVAEYLPEFTGEGKQAVMVHHLLTHTSGLRDEDVHAHAEKKQGSVRVPPAEESEHPFVHEALFLRYDAPLWKPPGAEMSYCGFGYALLGEIVRRISGRSLDDFTRERIFAPLGMKDTSYVVPDAVRHRIVKRPADVPFAGLDSREAQERPWGGGGAFSTAMEMAIFGQMFLNRGSYGGARILSPASVAEMTRNQTPGISASWKDQFFPEASWGYGWDIYGDKNARYSSTLLSPKAFGHSGAGGTNLRVDPHYGIVAAYFAVGLDWEAERQFDLFMDDVMSAVIDVEVEVGEASGSPVSPPRAVSRRSPRGKGERGMSLRPGTPEEVRMPAERVRHVADLANGWVEQGVTPALVVLAARRGVIVLHEAFGRLTPEPDSPPVQRDTIYPLASITKPIAATAAMILVEEGLLGINRPVAEYIPEFAGEGKQAVMVHHLLTHTSGLRDEDVCAYAEKQGLVRPPVPGELQHPSVFDTPVLGCEAPLRTPPGTEMAYCNYGYALVAEIVQRASGRPFADFARDRIFAPLGMNDTCYIVPEADRHRIVGRPADAPCANWLVREKSRGNSGVLSTAMEMAIFGQMFLNHGSYGEARVLSPASVAEMTRNQIPGIGARFGDEFFPEASWGLGWGIRGNKKYGGTLISPRTFDHGGSGGVFLWVDPVYEIVGLYFSVSIQSGKWNADLFVNAVTAAVIDK